MMTAKEAKEVIEKLVEKPEIGYLFYTFDHYKVLGLPSGEEITEKQISEAFKAKFLPCICKFSGLPSNLTDEEVTEKIQAMGWESWLQLSLKRLKEAESETFEFALVVFSYYILTDPEQRESFKNWRRLAKSLERLKIINREKEKMEEYELMSFDDLLRVWKLYPWMVGGLLVILPVWIPARLCWLIGRSSCKAIQSAVLKRSGTGSFTDDKKAGECSSGGEDIQDWELVNEDNWC